MAMRSTARRALACEQEAAELEVQLDGLVRRLVPELLGQLGIGSVVAGQLITSWSHHGRIRSEAAFAKLGGAAQCKSIRDIKRLSRQVVEDCASSSPGNPDLSYARTPTAI